MLEHVRTAPLPLIQPSISRFGSESYRADRVSNDDDELLSGYALISKHIAPYADVLLCETMRYNKCRPNARTLCALSLL